jgi:hypothetical protein
MDRKILYLVLTPLTAFRNSERFGQKNILRRARSHLKADKGLTDGRYDEIAGRLLGEY